MTTKKKRGYYCGCWYCVEGKTKKYLVLQRMWRREDRTESWRDD